MAVLRNIVGEGERNVGQWLRLAASPILGMPRGENHMCNVSLMKNTELSINPFSIVNRMDENPLWW